MRTYKYNYHTHFGIPLGIAPGWWDDRKKNHKPVLPINLSLDISNSLSRVFSWLRFSGHNFLVQRMRPHVISLRRNYAPLFPPTGAYDVFAFLSQNNNKLYFSP